MNLSRLLMVDVPGPTLDDPIIEHLRTLRPGGVCLFRKNIVTVEQTRALTNQLREVLGEDVLISIDQEGGGVFRTNDVPFTPSAMNLGASQDTTIACRAGEVVARGLRAMGINWNFAPVLDVNCNPHNPVISERSFGESAEHVARFALAFAEGLESSGVAACGKHFPGHGDTAIDSHLSLPQINKTQEALQRVEFLPFREAVRAGIASIMTAHVHIPAMDDLPATLSKRFLTDLLRSDWGYNGVIVTDSMDMKAIDGHWQRGEAAAISVVAGADAVLALGPIDAQHETLAGLQSALISGFLTSKRVEESVVRLAQLAARFPATDFAYPSNLRMVDEAQVEQDWLSGITSVGEIRLPQPASHIVLIVADNAPGENVVQTGFNGATLIKALSDDYEVVPIVYNRVEAMEVASKVQSAREQGKYIIFASTHRTRLSQSECQLATLAQPDLHLALWNPYAVLDVDAPAIVSYGFRPPAVNAVIRILRGEASARGQLPIRLIK